ncbi:uncharacterized protein LOC129609831 [Condylostylus longicornis]|uniref:uncharacterized protein LOC129609831 n=1 Tax=Condylostylus longicornis TaxID=2530218 RepID=UPI00244DFAC6|nr:uncharacterized protein LOC129609831 [Condylostylus longicornis]
MSKTLNLINELNLNNSNAEECINDFDGKYLRLTNEFQKNASIDYNDFLQHSGGITLEFLFRLNIYRNHTNLTLFDIKNSDGNFIIEILIFDDDYYFLKIIHKHIEKIPEDENEIYESDRLCKSFISDGKWHKLTFCITSNNYKVWLDEDLILDKTNPPRDHRNNLQFFSINDEQEYTIGRCDKQLLGLDIKQIAITNLLKEVNCEILADLNSDVSSHIDFKKKLNKNLQNIENDNEIFYQINEAIFGEIKIPEILTKPNQITNIIFECKFRHRGPIDGQMILLILKDNFENNSQVFAIDSGRLLCWNENFQYFKKSNQCRAKLEGINIYDGDWHTIKYQITPELMEEEYDDPILKKRIKFWVDEKLYENDLVSGPILFHSVLQQFVMFQNNFGNGYKNFDVKSIQFSVNEV